MSKPRDPRSNANQKAPPATTPRAPFARTDKKPARAQTSQLEIPKPKPSALAKSAKANRPDSTRAVGKSSDRKAERGSGRNPGQNQAENPARSVVRSLGATVSRRAADRLRAGHLWVYASDIESLELPGDAANSPPPLLPVADSRGLLLGTALYSPSSQIALRVVSREVLDEPAWLELLGARLRKAIHRRRSLLTEGSDACRLCFSEADELPGLIADKYGSLVILQLLTAGLNWPSVREICVRVLREELSPAAILERPDARVRELEGLPAADASPLYLADGSEQAGRTEFHINGLRFEFDAGAGQKTGAFLDQRDNYAAAQQWAQRLGGAAWEGGGRALDVCCYQGGFALHLAKVCGRVTGIDASRSSLEVAERNVVANRERIRAEVDWVEGDAFQILRDWSSAGERFDAIVLDPPAFAKSQRAVEGALRGYKELNLRALKMLRPGGLLVTCSCSHHVSWTDLEGSVAAAAVDAGRRVRLLERRGAALDHPVVLNLPETEYLKCLVLEAE